MILGTALFTGSAPNCGKSTNCRYSKAGKSLFAKSSLPTRRNGNKLSRYIITAFFRLSYNDCHYTVLQAKNM